MHTVEWAELLQAAHTAASHGAMLQLNLTQTRASNHLCSSAAKFGTNEGCGLDLIDFVASSIEAQLDQLLLMLTNNDNNNNNNNRKGNKNGPKLHQLGFSGDEDETDDEQTEWRPGSSSAGQVDAETLRRYVNSLRWCPTGGGCSNSGANGHSQKTNGCGNELTLRHLRQRFRPDVTRAYLALKAAELVGDFSGADAEQVDCSCEEKAFSLHFHGADSWCDLVAVIAALSESDQQLRLAVVCFCEEPALLPHLEFLREAILTSGLTRGCRVESMRLSSRPVTAEDLRLAATFQARDLGQDPPALIGFLSQRSALQASRNVWRELQRLHRRLYVVTAGAPPSALLRQSLQRCDFEDRTSGCGLQSWRFVQRKQKNLPKSRTASSSDEQTVSVREKLGVLVASIVLLAIFAQLLVRPLSVMTFAWSAVLCLGAGCILASVFFLHLALASMIGCLEANLERCVRQGRFEWRRCQARAGPAACVIGWLISTAAGAVQVAAGGGRSRLRRRTQ